MMNFAFLKPWTLASLLASGVAGTAAVEVEPSAPVSEAADASPRRVDVPALDTRRAFGLREARPSDQGVERAERANEQAQRRAERANEQAQRRAERANEQAQRRAERANERAQRRAERAKERPAQAPDQATREHEARGERLGHTRGRGHELARGRGHQRHGH